MIKAVLFDADGTLMDSIASWRKALKTVLERRGFSYSEEAVHILRESTVLPKQEMR